MTGGFNHGLLIKGASGPENQQSLKKRGNLLWMVAKSPVDSWIIPLFKAGWWLPTPLKNHGVCQLG